jgi:hypothetical protein
MVGIALTTPMKDTLADVPLKTPMKIAMTSQLCGMKMMIILTMIGNKVKE